MPMHETIIAVDVTDKIYDFPFIVTFEPPVCFNMSRHGQERVSACSSEERVLSEVTVEADSDGSFASQFSIRCSRTKLMPCCSEVIPLTIREKSAIR